MSVTTIPARRHGREEETRLHNRYTYQKLKKIVVVFSPYSIKIEIVIPVFYYCYYYARASSPWRDDDQNCSELISNYFVILTATTTRGYRCTYLHKDFVFLRARTRRILMRSARRCAQALASYRKANIF